MRIERLAAGAGVLVAERETFYGMRETVVADRTGTVVVVSEQT